MLQVLISMSDWLESTKNHFCSEFGYNPNMRQHKFQPYICKYNRESDAENTSSSMFQDLELYTVFAKFQYLPGFPWYLHTL